jgi:hypothetical protein
MTLIACPWQLMDGDRRGEKRFGPNAGSARKPGSSPGGETESGRCRVPARFPARRSGNAGPVDADEMLSAVAGATGLTCRQADDVLIATLTVASELASAGELRDLFDKLPKSVQRRVPLSGRTVSMRPTEFVARVAELTTANEEDTERNVRVALQVLAHVVDAGDLPCCVSEDKTDHLANVAAALACCSVFATFPALIVIVNAVRFLGP